MITASRIYDKQVVIDIITRSDIWATVAEDGQQIDEFNPDVEGECWLAMNDGETMVGLYNLHAHNAITVQIHAHVLPECRREHSKDTATAALTYIRDCAPDYLKVVAQIPFIYENVKNFTCGNGFQVEGVNRSSYIKDGKVVDQWMLGITRNEIEDFLNE